MQVNTEYIKHLKLVGQLLEIVKFYTLSVTPSSTKMYSKFVLPNWNLHAHIHMHMHMGTHKQMGRQTDKDR